MSKLNFFEELEKILKDQNFSTTYNKTIPQIWGLSLEELQGQVFHVSYYDENVDFTGFFDEFCFFLKHSHEKGLDLSILFSSIEVKTIEESYIDCSKAFLEEDYALYKFAKGELSFEEYSALFIEKMEKLKLLNLDTFKALRFFDVAKTYLEKMLEQTKSIISN